MSDVGGPRRTCVGCRCVDAKADLVRLVWDQESGRVIVDAAGRAPGRGVYVHPQCAQRGVRGVARTLRRPVDATQVAALLAQVANPA